MKLFSMAASAALLIAAGANAQYGEPIYHYQGEMAAQTETGFVDLDWHIEILDPDQQMVTFLLSSHLGNVEVSGDVANFQIAPQGPFNAIVIQLDAAGDGPRHIEMAYDGVLFPEPLENDINDISAERVELSVDGFWLPVDATFQGFFTADLTVDVGAPWSGIANGEVMPLPTGVRVINTDPSLDIAFTLAPSFRTTHHDGFSLHDLRTFDDGSDVLIDAATFCVDYLNGLYGETDPLPHINFTINNRSGSAYNRRSYISLTDISDAAPETMTQFVCHELSHHWSFGANFNTVENWLNESFAEYAGNMAVREQFGEAVFIDRMNLFVSQIEDQNLPAIWTPGATDRGPELVNYRAGPVALWHLETYLGRPIFARFITRYMVDGIDTTPDLLAMLEEVAGTDARIWFEAKLAQTAS